MKKEDLLFYESPSVEVLDTDAGEGFLVSSPTGEAYGDQRNYGGF